MIALSIFLVVGSHIGHTQLSVARPSAQLSVRGMGLSVQNPDITDYSYLTL